MFDAARINGFIAHEQETLRQFRREQDADCGFVVQPPSGGGGTPAIVRMATVTAFTTGYTGVANSGIRADILDPATGAVIEANADVYVLSYDGFNGQNNDQIGQHDLTRCLPPIKQGWRVIVEKLTLHLATGARWWLRYPMFRGGCS